MVLVFHLVCSLNVVIAGEAYETIHGYSIGSLHLEISYLGNYKDILFTCQWEREEALASKCKKLASKLKPIARVKFYKMVKR